jgi:flagellar motor component MotA
MISIQVGENPRLIKEKLLGCMPESFRKKALKESASDKNGISQGKNTSGINKFICLF